MNGRCWSTDEIATLRSEIAAMRESLDALTQRVPELEESRADAAKLRAELDAVKSRIPERTRKKLGI